MKNNLYSTILFDFDGTLTSSLCLWIKAYQFALKDFGIKLSSEDVMRKCFYKSWEDVVKEFELPSVSAFETLIYIELERAFDEAQLFEGVVPALEQLRRKDIKLGIVTSSSRKIVQKFLHTHGIHVHFNSLITADDIENFKPHPEPVLKALSQLDSHSAQTLMIGDSVADMIAAQAANVDRALFFPEEHHEFYNLEELKLHQPSFLFHNYFELPSSIEQHCLTKASVNKNTSPAEQTIY